MGVLKGPSKWHNTYYQQLKNAIYEILGRKCIRCGFDDPRALQIDHVDGGGHQEKKSMTTSYYKHVLEEILKGSKKYQVLCANCNWIKRAENREVRRVI